MIDYPVDAVTAKDKTEYLYIAQKALRLLNNKFVEWHEDGLLQADYDTFPKDIKRKYGFVNSIDLTMLKRWMNEDFMPRSAVICHGITVERAKLSKEDKEDIMGVQSLDGALEVAGTKHLLLQSKRWSVDISKIKAIRVVIG